MTNLNANSIPLQVPCFTLIAEKPGLPEENGKMDLSLFLREVETTSPHLMTPERLQGLVVRLLKDDNFRDLVNTKVLYRPDRPGVQELVFSKFCSGLVSSLLHGQKVPSHSHGDSFEVGIVFQGTLSVIDYQLLEDRELLPVETEVEEGGVFVTERYAEHKILNNSGAKCVSVNFHSPGWRVSK